MSVKGMAEGKTRWIYLVLDHCGRVRYVGCSVNPYARFFNHLTESRRAAMNRRDVGGDLFHRWIYATIRRGRFPSIKIVAIADVGWDAVELAEIEKQKIAGSPLMNSVIKGHSRSIRLLENKRRVKFRSKGRPKG